MKKLFLKLRDKRKKGFTLLEMLIVVVILGVLTAIAVPTYNKVIKRSRVADGLNMLDVLASAQNKYFVEHGQYTDNLADLNAPVKKNNIINDFKIITTNFTYTKEPQKSCIYAESADGKYTLAKNYKTNSKPKCSGSICEDISSFVETGNLDMLCPQGSDECNLTEEICLKNGFVGFKPAPVCQCIPMPIQECNLNLEKCIDQGFTGFDEANCRCIGLSVCKDGNTQWIDLDTICSPVEAGDASHNSCGHKRIQQICQNGIWVNTSTESCSNQWLISQCGGSANVNWGNDKSSCTCKEAQCSADAIQFEQTEEPCNGSYFANGSDGKTLSGGGNRGTSNSGVSYSQEIKCGLKRKELKCSKDGRWQYTGNYECHQRVCGGIGSNWYLNLETCNCERTCTPPKPTLSQLNCPAPIHPVELCDPCPNTPSNPSIIQNIINQTSVATGLDPKGISPSSNNNVSTECFHCGYRTVSYEVACNDGSWQCANTNTCHNVSGSVPAYNGECDGGMNNGNKCGAYKLTNVNCKLNDSFSGADLLGVYSNTCQPKPGNACFTGQTRPCDSSSTSTTVPNDRGGNSPKGGIVNNNNLIQVCQDDCQWSECFPDPNASLCPEIPNPEGSQYQLCNNDDPNLCGTKTAVLKCDVSTEYKWIWDFSNAICENVSEKPDPGYAYKCDPEACLVHEPIYKCDSLDDTGTGYGWVQDGFTECHFREGANCSNTPPYSAQLGPGQFCNNCKKSQCPAVDPAYSDYGIPVVYNAYKKGCYSPIESKRQVLQEQGIPYNPRIIAAHEGYPAPNQTQATQILANTFKYCPSGSFNHPAGNLCKARCNDVGGGSSVQTYNGNYDYLEYCRSSQDPTKISVWASGAALLNRCSSNNNVWDYGIIASGYLGCYSVNPVLVE